jgi:hypothetical protein
MRRNPELLDFGIIKLFLITIFDRTGKLSVERGN